MIERETGDKFTINGVPFVVRGADRCGGCEFRDVDCSQISNVLGRCWSRRRKDRQDVVFAKDEQPDTAPMTLAELKDIVSQAMFRFSETNGMGIELRCKADARPSMTERKFGLYNFHVIVGNNENK